MKRIFILFVCASSFAVKAEPLGRLFYTPEQRAQLDNARRTTPMNTGVEAETVIAPNVTLRGIVTRSDGKRTVWMNNHLEHSVMQKGAQERNQTQVQLPGGEVKLKVGQRIDSATGQVAENYRLPAPEVVAAKPAPAPKETSKAPVPKPRDEDKEPE